MSIQNFNGFILDEVTIKNYFRKLPNQLLLGFFLSDPNRLENLYRSQIYGFIIPDP